MGRERPRLSTAGWGTHVRCRANSLNSQKYHESPWRYNGSFVATASQAYVFFRAEAWELPKQLELHGTLRSPTPVGEQAQSGRRTEMRQVGALVGMSGVVEWPARQSLDRTGLLPKN